MLTGECCLLTNKGKILVKYWNIYFFFRCTGECCNLVDSINLLFPMASLMRTSGMDILWQYSIYQPQAKQGQTLLYPPLGKVINISFITHMTLKLICKKTKNNHPVLVLLSTLLFLLIAFKHVHSIFIAGHVRLNVSFNMPVDIALEALIYCEFTSSLFLNKAGMVTGSYL